MSEKLEFINEQVLEARTRFIGHIHEIRIELIFKHFVVYINPNRSWFADKGKDKFGNTISRMPFYDLFGKVFDIDCEDGANIEDLKGKYCRALRDGLKVVALYHIIDDVYVEIDDLK